MSDQLIEQREIEDLIKNQELDHEYQLMTEKLAEDDGQFDEFRDMETPDYGNPQPSGDWGKV